MCLGIPGQIIELNSANESAVVDVLGAHKQISTAMLDKADRLRPGDWVVVHMGFAMETIEADEAKAVLGELETVHNMGTLDPEVDFNIPQA